MVRERRKKTEENEDLSASGMGDWVKRNLMEKLGTLLVAEEGIRHDLLDLKLPKSVITAALAQADRTKKDISSLVAKEVRMFLDGIELAELIKKVIAGQSIEISARIKFGSDEPGPKKAVRKKPKKAA